MPPDCAPHEKNNRSQVIGNGRSIAALSASAEIPFFNAEDIENLQKPAAVCGERKLPSEIFYNGAALLVGDFLAHGQEPLSVAFSSLPRKHFARMSATFLAPFSLK